MSDCKHDHDHDCDCGCGCEHETEADIITLTDDETGENTDYMVVDGVEHNDNLYLALVEAEHADDDECEFIILKCITGEDQTDDTLVTIDDEDEFNTVLKLFEARAETAGLFDFDTVEKDIQD